MELLSWTNTEKGYSKRLLDTGTVMRNDGEGWKLYKRLRPSQVPKQVDLIHALAANEPEKWLLGATIETQRAEVRKYGKAELRSIFAAANRAAREAYEAKKPTPMVVSQHTNMADDNSPVVKRWQVSEGVCGFAWVRITPGNCAAANYARKHLGGGTGYEGGLIWYPDIPLSQSYDRKTAACHAAVRVLKDNGITAYTESRLD